MDDNNSILTKEKYAAMAKRYEESENDNYDLEQECAAYKQALKDIINASMVSDMIRIAQKVLLENRK